MIKTAHLDAQEQVADALLACPIMCPVELQILAGSHVYRLRSRLIGIDAPHCLLLRYGTDQSWKDASHVLEAGQPVILRMVNEIGQCQLLAFRTQLGLNTKVPRRWMSVVFPDIIESANMRQQKRIRVKFPCYLEWGEKRKKLTVGHITDLSSNGCRIETELAEPIPDGTEIHIRFKNDAKLILPATIRNANSTPQGQVLHGVQFQELNLVERNGLSEVMLANY